MPEAAFVDANIAIYASGGDHPYRDPCITILAECARHPGATLSSAEVCQELLNLYLRRGEPERAKEMVENFDRVLSGFIEGVERRDILNAAAHLPAPSSLQARDRIHLAVMRRLGLTSIISTDATFDLIPGITRLDPHHFEAWRATVFGSH